MKISSFFQQLLYCLLSLSYIYITNWFSGLILPTPTDYRILLTFQFQFICFAKISKHLGNIRFFCSQNQNYLVMYWRKLNLDYKNVLDTYVSPITKVALYESREFEIL